MSALTVDESWRRLPRIRGVGLLLRGLILVSPLAALACTRAATDHPLPVIDVVIVILAIGSVFAPDGPLGALVIMLVAIEWGATVHDRTTFWAVAVAAALAMFHVCLAAATVSPPGARWTSAMCRRWTRRAAVAMGSGVTTWAVLVAIDGYEMPSSAILVAASLVVLALAGLWARDGHP